MKILLLSAYDAASHRHWHQFLVENMPQHEWQVLTLPPRHFSWRIRGNSLTWAFDENLKDVSKFDCLIATSMVDLSSLRGMLPELCKIPTALYFHENQFCYPVTTFSQQSIDPQMVTLYSAISADFLIFNSLYNQQSFFLGVDALLRKFPDGVPKGIAQNLERKSRCIAVPIHDVSIDRVQKSKAGREKRELTIIWNHRWEYDKGPELLAQCIECLPSNLAFKFHIVGQRFRTIPPVFEKILDLLKDRHWLGEWGFIENKNKYRDLLGKSDVVLSTAQHDFQGLSVLEAVAEGCVPVVPSRLVYPEWFSSQYCYSDQGDEVENLCEHLTILVELSMTNQFPMVPDVRRFSWSVLDAKYQQLISELTDHGE